MEEEEEKEEVLVKEEEEEEEEYGWGRDLFAVSSECGCTRVQCGALIQPEPWHHPLRVATRPD